MISSREHPQLKYQEIITGLRTLRSSDFDYNNMEAQRWERLWELTDALMAIPGCLSAAAIPEWFSVMEGMPDADLGSPRPLEHPP